jgi:hypothetical protein
MQDARAIAAITRNVRSLWLGSLAMLKSHRDAAKARYSFKYTNGTQTIEDTRALEFSTDRAARREALRTAREMASNVSWASSQRGAGWTVLVINPMGQQICEVPVRFKKRWF